jgi:import receptor subunit TOM20
MVISSLPKNAVFAAGICGAVFVGYCVYFDRKRRSDPDFKRKLKERRVLKKLQEESKTGIKFPTQVDEASINSFIFEQLQMGEDLLIEGSMEEAARHLAYGIIAGGRPMEMLDVMRQTVPPPIIDMIGSQLPKASQDFAAAMKKAGHPGFGKMGQPPQVEILEIQKPNRSKAGESPNIVKIADEDVE